MDTKLAKLQNRLKESDEKITPYYCTHNDILFIRQKPHQDHWKIVIPPTKEKTLIMNYHVRYGHMGALKVVKALVGHVYIRILQESTLS